MYRHPFDAISFAFGLVFAAVAGFAVIRVEVDGQVAEWFWPTALVLLGSGLVISTLRSRGAREEDEPPA